MVTNRSDSSKTIKSSLTSILSDNWTIDKVIKYTDYLGIVTIPNGLILDDYADYFETKLIEVNVNESYYYSPSLFSDEYYGTPGLDWLVLYFAKIPTLFEFNKPKIKILPLSALNELNSLIVEKKKEVSDSKENPESVILSKSSNVDDVSKSARATGGRTISSSASLSTIITNTTSNTTVSNAEVSASYNSSAFK